MRTFRITASSATAVALATTTIFVPTAIAQTAPAAGGVEIIDSADGEVDDVLTGYVFEDTNGNSSKDDDEPGIPGVAVSNGAGIVTTDDEGRYEIPVDDNTTVFITQPSGYQVPVDEHNVAQFYYNHVPEGSPELRYGGLEATGPTPEAVNFPLTVSEQAAAPEQNCIIGGDVQTYDQDEVGYAANGAFRDLAERDDYTECGALFIGDVVGDDLSLYPEIRELTAGINGPARFLPGNHDLDFDAESGEHKFATYRQQFGPEYYSYDVGNAHIISLESVEYPVSDGEYNGAIDDEQMEWLRQDIANTPEDKLIVLASHIPLVGFADYSSTQHQIDQFTEIAELVEGRETIAVSGHTHAVANLREGDSLSGWKEVHGIDGLPFTNVVAGGISGDWYSGKMGDDGYPLSYGRDGSKPGVLTLEINDNQVSEYFTVVGGDQSDQMNIGLNTPAYREWFDKHVAYEDSNAENTGPVEPFAHPNAVPVEDLAETYLTTNFWMGSTGSEVTVSFDGGEAVPAERTQPMQGEEQYAGAEYSDPVAVQEQLVHGGSIADRAAHIWRIPLPEGLEEGTHTAEVTATDVHGRSFTETYEFTVGAESSDSVESFLPGSSGSLGSSGSSGSSLLGSSFSS